MHTYVRIILVITSGLAPIRLTIRYLQLACISIISIMYICSVVAFSARTVFQVD